MEGRCGVARGRVGSGPALVLFRPHAFALCLQAEREDQLQALSMMLDSLWDALGLPLAHPERKTLSVLFASDDRLHGCSIELVRAKLWRGRRRGRRAPQERG